MSPEKRISKSSDLAPSFSSVLFREHAETLSEPDGLGSSEALGFSLSLRAHRGSAVYTLLESNLFTARLRRHSKFEPRAPALSGQKPQPGVG